ncbi:MAG: hypothetical protein DMF75_11965 [Acidobacteria bacterium]|nr:MAG: hypothetical protein DMF75_11965 [Acidobacteriota bacterium]
MDELKKTYVVDEQNHKIAVQLDIDTFNRIEEVIENYALARLMKDRPDEALDLDDALAHYEDMEKAE